MPSSPQMPTIPTPLKDNLDNRYEVIVALKMVVEMMLGTRGDQPVNRVFVSNSQPTAYNTGDQWINQNTGQMKYWDGKSWLPLRPS